MDGGDYQWVDCDNDFAEIEGETNQLFEALENGTYAVIVSDGSCTDTSACFTVDNIGLAASDVPVLNAYPNPNNGEFTLDCSGIEGAYSISIYNEAGQIVMDRAFYEVSGEHLIRLPQTPGVYHVEVSAGDNVYELPILIH